MKERKKERKKGRYEKKKERRKEIKKERKTNNPDLKRTRKGNHKVHKEFTRTNKIIGIEIWSLKINFGNWTDLEPNFILNWIWIIYKLTFSIQICHPKLNYCNKIDSRGSEINQQFRIRSKEIKTISNLIEKAQKSQSKSTFLNFFDQIRLNSTISIF